MRRFLILLLIFLLPVQVFAGMGALRVGQHGAAGGIDAVAAIAASRTVSEITGQTAPAGQPALADASDNDLSGHASFGDEAVLTNFLVFKFPDPAFVSVLRDDVASVAPYLPPAARPPRA
jgi:hypothetical protein